MDLEIENRIATTLLREAAELRRQAEMEGMQAYHRKPSIRGRPNSRFLSATVLGVQQANKAVEVNEMWRARQKELQIDVRLKSHSVWREDSNKLNGIGESLQSSSKKRSADDSRPSTSYSSSQTTASRLHSESDETLRDEEIEEFLHSRVKRGRGAVGSRMDEPGPYLSSPSDEDEASAGIDARGRQIVLGPDKPTFANSHKSSEDELDRKKARSSGKKHSNRHKSKEKSKEDKRKKRKERVSTSAILFIYLLTTLILDIAVKTTQKDLVAKDLFPYNDTEKMNNERSFNLLVFRYSYFAARMKKARTSSRSRLLESRKQNLKAFHNHPLQQRNSISSSARPAGVMNPRSGDPSHRISPLVKAPRSRLPL